MSNQPPYINRSLFSKPPPNFNKDNSSKWNNFKVPTSPIANNNSKKISPPNNSSRNYPTNSQSTSRHYATQPDNASSPTQTRNYSNLQNHQSGSQNVPSRPSGSQTQTGSRNYTNSSPSAARNYQTTPPPNVVRNFKNEPPPNYKVQRANVSPENRYKDLVYNPIGLIPAQQFKLNVPPPKIQKPIQYEMNLEADPAAVQAQMLSAATLEKAKANYYMQMLYRYHQVADYSQSLVPYSTAPVQPPPPNYPPPQQPPLPPGAPPQKPPPPPSSTTRSRPPSAEYKMSKHNYQNHPLPSLTSSPMSMQNHQNRNQPPMGNFHSRMPHQFNAYHPQFNKPMHYNLKRKFDGNAEQKIPKKKKKPLSQVVPLKISWSMEDAKKALDVERECNKRSRRQGLIIKFPDQELNRDIVTNFHTSIEAVHFQQPSTQRYCFVTLMDSADPETVIRHLNQIPFGLGHLTAEHKKDREDEQNIRPCDIDPLTLYVGNLAQEITKDDMTKTYPKQKRIDIGYAKKMKYTRYAFVSFHSVDDAIEAFKKTHSSQMYSKSLIVRFRRLHGTVGLPGETKGPLAARSAPENGGADTVNNNNAWDIDVSHWDNEDTQTPDTRPLSEDEDEDEEAPKMQHYVRPDDFQTNFDAPYTYVPRNVTVKVERSDEETNGYQSDDQHSNVSNPPTPETPDHYDEPNGQTELDTKQELIKEEESFPNGGPIQFRVLQDTINVRPSSVILQPDQIAPIGSEPSSNNADTSTDGGANVKREDDEVALENVARRATIAGIPRTVEIQNIVASSLIVPAPIMIKRERDEDSDDDGARIEVGSSAAQDGCAEAGAGILKNVEIQNIVASSSIVPAPIMIKRERDEDSDDDDGARIIAGPSVAKDGCASEDLRDDSSDAPPVGGLEKSSERCDSGAENFDWDVGANYPIRDIKAELEFDDPAGDDNSSDEELDIHDILKKQKKVIKEKGD